MNLMRYQRENNVSILDIKVLILIISKSNMTRIYERPYKSVIISKKWRNSEGALRHDKWEHRTYTYKPRDLRVVHIFGNAWKCGRVKTLKKNGAYIDHIVIYGPENKEHHVYGEETTYFCRYNGYKNEIDAAQLKIYILTRILDNIQNWEFDLKTPVEDGVLKVIYENGTIRNVIYQGSFSILTSIIRYKHCKVIAYRKPENKLLCR